MLKMKMNKGFTLVEMAIVLVIIGLIVSSVMAGQTLVQSASIRSTIAQIDGIRSSTNAFQSKYNGIAGDLLYSQASFWSLPYGTSASGNGDGDMILSGVGGSSTNATTQDGENLFFWLQLSAAGLMTGSFNGITYTSATSAEVSDLTTAFVSTKLNTSVYFMVYSSNTINYLGLIGASSIASGTVTTSDLLLANQLYQVDKKMDDGLPNSGLLRATSGFSESSVNTTNCVSSTDSTGIYQVDSTTPACSGAITLLIG